MSKEAQYYTVSAINKYIEYKLSTDLNLKLVYIKGELSNCRFSKGHLYFILKDSESEMSGIIFASLASKLTFIPKDGMQVLIIGQISPYYKKGTYNLIVSEIKENGKGNLYQKFLETKERLESIGLFNKEHKKQIPMFSEKIGVITSSTGDALNDIVSTIERRFPLVNVYVYPALVQGQDAPKSLIKALNKVEKDNFVDVVIIARGGGSFEDLDCFNDETLAKAIYDFSIPIVSGVGHENDYTICDFVCDDRAPTPTGAAVKVTPDKESLYQTLNNVNHKLSILEKRIIDRKINDFELLSTNYYLKSLDNNLKPFSDKYDRLNARLLNNSPSNTLNQLDKTLESLNKRIELYNFEGRIEESKDKINLILNNIYKAIQKRLDKNTYEFNYLLDKLTLVNPLDIMKKGYTIVYKDNKLVSSSKEVDLNDELVINFHDGKKKVKVI